MPPLTPKLVLNLVAAGHETAASALQWATYAMVRYPDAQEQLRAEVLDLLKRNPVPEYSEIEGLSYMNNLYKEVLRLWCPGTEYLRLLIWQCFCTAAQLLMPQTI